MGNIFAPHKNVHRSRFGHREEFNNHRLQSNNQRLQRFQSQSDCPSWYYGSQSSSTNYAAILINLIATSKWNAAGTIPIMQDMYMGQSMGYIAANAATFGLYWTAEFTSLDNIPYGSYYPYGINNIPIQQIDRIVNFPWSGTLQIMDVDSGNIYNLGYYMTNTPPPCDCSH